MMSRLYFAEPSVFRPESIVHDEALKALYAESGFIGLYPLDNAVAPQADGPTIAEEIYRRNIALIDSAGAVLASAASPRSREPDSGTCLEIGYAITRGKDMWCCHVPAAPLLAQVPNTSGNDADGWAVKNSGLSHNLTITCSYHLVTGDARACLGRMRVYYTQSRAGYAYADRSLQGSRGHPCSACTGQCLRREVSA